MPNEIDTLHKVAYFIGALAHGAEQNLGKASSSICFMAGKKFGLEALSASGQTDDPVKALEILRQALADRGIVWDFEPFGGEHPELIEDTGDNHKKIRLVFHTCMVRNALFCYSHEQRQSLCQMAHGVFAGAMEKIMPVEKVDLECIHAGPNACLKEMIWEVRP